MAWLPVALGLGSLGAGLVGSLTGGDQKRAIQNLIASQIQGQDWLLQQAQRREQEQAPLRGGLIQSIQGLLNRPVPQVQFPALQPWNPYAALAPKGVPTTTTYKPQVSYQPSGFQFKPGPPAEPLPKKSYDGFDTPPDPLLDRLGGVRTGETTYVFPEGEGSPGGRRIVVDNRDPNNRRYVNEAGQDVTDEIAGVDQTAAFEVFQAEMEAWPEYTQWVAAYKTWKDANPDTKGTDWPLLPLVRERYDTWQKSQEGE